MQIDGEEKFDQEINAVWAALHDTNLLVKAIPGCKSMKSIGGSNYAVAVSLGVAAVKGEYEGKVKVIDLKAPVHYQIEGEGAGAPGFVKLKMDVQLERLAAGTLMKWKCDSETGGLIASIGGRVLSGISKFMAKQFFKSFKSEMEKGATAKAA